MTKDEMKEQLRQFRADVSGDIDAVDVLRRWLRDDWFIDLLNEIIDRLPEDDETK